MESMYENAACIAMLTPVPQNGRAISNGMAACFEIHKFILQKKTTEKTDIIMRTFPHFLQFEGTLVQQAFERIHPQYNQQANLGKFLSLGLMLETDWIEVEDKHVRGALRVMKKLTNRRIRRTICNSNLSLAEITAAPLIQWIKPLNNKTDFEAVEHQLNQITHPEPRIICVSTVFTKGNLFIVLKKNILPCGNDSIRAIDVLLKLFAVFGINVPPLLKKFFDIVSIYVYKISIVCRSNTVAALCSRFRELDESPSETPTHLLSLN
ncbi:uncharacterized protein LOC129729481 isoform X1 [Wyeomyia smithii]|uniref:uncharacterized protein LOC129729481 isoform X1 n=1 Tax=Wyeomyia smithii TaxID=174621 RepID=UPI002467C76C|nr:uncharacterized protein LOC129729481 isoform X1 [Wyeomyia smithii]XP_055544055.1 uncharacterized protein LOC129729481 isoform X1 [Wyeomyia smithii]XP_055544056.1 uncharacterized protein LOC129729481 isoform X1 [Wyeomyia smithii]